MSYKGFTNDHFTVHNFQRMAEIPQNKQEKSKADPDEDSGGSTVDSEQAEQAGRRQQTDSCGEWFETGASTFLDSDWPSFKNTTHSLCLSICLSPCHCSGASKQIKYS